MKTSDLHETEADFQRNVQQVAAVLGFEQQYHTKDSRGSGRFGPRGVKSKGFPDLTMASTSRHRIVYLELKSSLRWDYTDDQKRWIAALQACGAEAYPAWPRDFDAIVKGLQTGDWSGLQGEPVRATRKTRAA